MKPLSNKDTETPKSPQKTSDGGHLNTHIKANSNSAASTARSDNNDLSAIVASADTMAFVTSISTEDVEGLMEGFVATKWQPVFCKNALDCILDGPSPGLPYYLLIVTRVEYFLFVANKVFVFFHVFMFS